jgi:hypothetical protein
MRLIDGRFGYRESYEAGAGFSWLSAMPVLTVLVFVGSLVWVSNGFNQSASWAHFAGSILITGLLIVFMAGLLISIVRGAARLANRLVRYFRG